ncbi:MAG: hypothetical protein JXB13_01590 [Phycisphaerae bacterium]|nr:hypothetical protein [Phycisphaerae bacterium]
MTRNTAHVILRSGVLLLCAGTGGCLGPPRLESALEDAIFGDPRFIIVHGDCCAIDCLTRRDVEAEVGPDRAVSAEPPEPMDEFLRAGFGLCDITQAKPIAAALAQSRPSIVFVLYEDKADAPAAIGLANRLNSAGVTTGATDTRSPVRIAKPNGSDADHAS